MALTSKLRGRDVWSGQLDFKEPPPGVASCISPNPSAWMEESWDQIKDQRIVDLMMPGSHNSGASNLEQQGKCMAVYESIKRRIQEEAPDNLKSLITDGLLEAYWKPWNENQKLSISEQLEQGVRWFHLKVCNFVGENSRFGPFNLSEVYHAHGGFTSVTLESILLDILSFLNTNPKEVAVLGLNDLFEIENLTSFGAAVAQLVEHQSRVQLIRAEDWMQTLEALQSSNRRLAVFLKDNSTEGILPSDQYLVENWNDEIMASDDFERIKSWLEQDATQHAALPRQKFYAFSAHPSKNPSRTTAQLLSQGSEPMLKFQRQWFQGYFPAFAEQLVESNRSLVLNGISTDFVEESGAFMLAMRLQNFCGTSTTTTATATATTITATSITVTTSNAESVRPVFQANLSGAGRHWPMLSLFLLCEVANKRDGRLVKDGTRRCSALSAALGAGLGLLAAKQLGFQAKLAYNAAFVCGATAGAALGSARWLWQGKDVSFCGRLVLGALMCETFQQVVHNKFCNLLFRCNCTWEWAGGWDNCNVHNATGPRCPWCVARQSISWTTDCLPLALMLLTFAEANCRGWPWLLQLLLPVLSFLLLGHLARCACGRLVLRCQFRTEPPIGRAASVPTSKSAIAWQPLPAKCRMQRCGAVGERHRMLTMLIHV
ncbi:unnamed protein product [Effrenium voratum]|nr:unnamed protein product [Effrenium voratum]